MQCPGSGRDPPRPFAWLLQHRLLFYPGPLPRETGLKRHAARADVLAFYGGARSDRVHARGKSELGWASRDVWKNLRTLQAGECFPLERAFRLFRSPRSKGETRSAIERG